MRSCIQGKNTVLRIAKSWNYREVSFIDVKKGRDIDTFASPRPADDIFATSLNRFMENGPHYRVVNDGDIVPHVPPEPFFSHPGNRILLEYNKRETSKSEWTRMRKRMFEVLMKMTGQSWEIANNHRLHTESRGYIARLIRDVARQKKST